MRTSTQPTRTAAEKEKTEISKNQAPSRLRLFNGDRKVFIVNMQGRTVGGLWRGPEQGEKAVDQTWPAKAGLEELRGASMDSEMCNRAF